MSEALNTKISVIVPVYKVEPYLNKCVDSILAQTYTNLEIILVDDGSPDNCGAICDEYANRDSRIRVIHKENGGLSDARNAGMRIMTGAYVAFVDSDDWIEPTMYETLLDLLQRFKADMAFGGVADDLVRGESIQTIKISNYGQTPFAEDKVAAMKRYFYGSWAAWDKLYRTDLFVDIVYPVGEINEDEAIVLHLLDRCERVCYTNEVLYHYMKRDDGTSITTSTFSSKKLAWTRHCKANFEWIQANHPELEAAAAARYRSSLLWSLTEMALVQGDYRNEIKELVGELKANRKLFQTIPYQYSTDKIRNLLLTYLPFAFYKAFIRLKRNH